MSKTDGFTIGADPEIFIVNAKGEPVSAVGIIPGTKQVPHVLEGGSCHPDGLAAEFGITPCTTVTQFVTRCTSVMEQMKQFLPEGHSFSIVPYVRFSEEEFNKAPDDAKELGCTPDFNAWTGEMNPVPSLENDPYLRTGSGHVHIGFPGSPYELNDEQHMQTCREFIQQCDWFIGTWTCTYDKDPTRRQLYGAAGAFRPKTYGVEYRTPSNQWLVNPNRMENMFNRIRTAIRAMRNSQLATQVTAGENELLVKQINEAKLEPEFAHKWRYPIVSIAAY